MEMLDQEVLASELKPKTCTCCGKTDGRLETDTNINKKRVQEKSNTT